MVADGNSTAPVVPELAADEDPVERAFRLAPFDNEPMTDEERAAMAVTPERWIPHAEVVAELKARHDLES